MKSIQYKSLFASLTIALFAIGCNNDDNSSNNGDTLDFSGTYTQQDQMGRPAINTVFVTSGNKDRFNTTIPSAMGASFQSDFQDQLLALNGDYTTNALGHDATTFTSILATDVLNVSTTGATTFFGGNNVLTGRNLTDDVIDVELLLIFGGPTGGDKTALTSDNVSANDKDFLTSFPYLASPW